MVATKRGPFLSTSMPPKAAARPITPMQIMKVTWVGGLAPAVRLP